ncbi:MULTISPECIES: DUF342 domain-containing protein [unclassified Fusibacter]|uniref:DUF342 domain-containing protein n=1 Tax=unclassified Fusibacter TaxID=2624464 RepID=UPI001013523B|nr:MULTISPECIES: FapA family protein [unclassified Fusibacter]MCK8060359.1 FapA family protein [Fusibacter sp. A2]NPE20352.1 DUF342 domain-containing protein [Fusibacter sp. A1]RXV63558.1 DUF342 domain-containing protein [Fusibacter sp. A1]
MNKKTDVYELMLFMADDYYSATMSLNFYSEPETSIFDEVMAVIRESNISFGILEEDIREACDRHENIEHLVIAKGIRHINGVDAKIIEHVAFESKATPYLNADGSVDFKNMNFAKTVTAGDLLVSKIPVKEGSDGTTVTGKAIKHKPGKDVRITYGENTVISEDELELKAEIDGIVKRVNGRVTVINLIELGTVGPETGNIYFSGNVHVKESVLDGYTINCDGDLTIDGVVEGCMIKVKGDLIVGKGILGHGESDIVVNGNLTAKFIENANVYVKGEIQTGEIINSSVLCDSKITVKGNKGLIIGGEITSKYMIDANRIGSKLGVITSINLGINASAIQELKLLKETIQELKIIEGKLKLQIPIFQKKIEEEPENEQLLNKAKQYRDSLLSTQIDLEDKAKRLDKLMDALKHVKDGKVKINTIYPDTVIKIGNSSYFIDHALSECVITRENDKVIAIGL